MKLREKTTATLLIAIFLISAFAIVMSVSATTPITIDGILSDGEWDGYLWFDATLSNQHTQEPAWMHVHIYITNDADNLYVALDIPDTYDMRPYPTAEGGCDAFGLNIGLQGEERTYKRILQFATLAPLSEDWKWFAADGYWAQWGEAISDGDTSKWGPTMEFLPIPIGVQSVTVFGPYRIQEIAIPLSDLGVSLGDEIHIGGSIRAAGYRLVGGNPYNFKTVYPAGLDWDNAESYRGYTLWAPPTKASILQDRGVPGKGIDDAPGLDKLPPNDNFGGRNRHNHGNED